MHTHHILTYMSAHIHTCTLIYIHKRIPNSKHRSNKNSKKQQLTMDQNKVMVKSCLQTALERNSYAIHL